MKQKTFLTLLGAVFAALMALVVFTKGSPDVFSSIMAFPFEQIGAGLRALAQTGSIGNGLAFALCAALSLLPMGLMLCRKGEDAFRGEKWYLTGMGAVLFCALYFSANPNRLVFAVPVAQEGFLPIVKGMLGGTGWSFLILWLVLRLNRLFRAGSTEKLLRYLRASLYALCLLFDAVIALSCGGTLVSGLSAAQQSMDGVMAVLRFLAAALPYGMDIAVTYSLLSLLDAFMKGEDGAIAKQAAALSHLCGRALCAAMAAAAALNGIQLLFSRFLSDVAVSVELPFVSLVFLLLVLLLSRLIAENQKLQRDNDLFI